MRGEDFATLAFIGFAVILLIWVFTADDSTPPIRAYDIRVRCVQHGGVSEIKLPFVVCRDGFVGEVNR